jgi:CRP-like cAMP-binding protein
MSKQPKISRSKFQLPELNRPVQSKSFDNTPGAFNLRKKSIPYHKNLSKISQSFTSNTRSALSKLEVLEPNDLKSSIHEQSFPLKQSSTFENSSSQLSRSKNRHRSLDYDLETNCRIILGEGNFFPEWLLKRKDFQEAIVKFSAIKQLDVGTICQIPARFRSSIEKEALVEWTKKVPFFKKISFLSKQAVCDKLVTEDFKEGDAILKEGEVGDRLYILTSGTVTIVKEGQKQPIATNVGPPNALGETAIATGSLRNASVVAETDVTALRLLFSDYERVLLKQKIVEKYDTRKFLNKVPVFNTFGSIKLDRIANYIFSVEFGSEQEIYKLGDDPMHLYIVKEGIVHLEVIINIKQKNRWPKGSKEWQSSYKVQKYHKIVRVVGHEDYFGERELVLGCARNTRAVSKTANTTLLAIRFEHFNELFTRAEQKMLLSQHETRPSTPMLQQELTKELQGIIHRKNALLDASNFNGLPTGRDALSKVKEAKKLIWANYVIKLHEEKAKKDLIRKEMHRYNSNSVLLPSLDI